MLNRTHHNTNRPASALLISALCAMLLGSVCYADEKSYKPGSKTEKKQPEAAVQ